MDDLLQSVHPLAKGWRVGPIVGGGFRRFQWRVDDDRFYSPARPSARCDGQKVGCSDNGMGRSQGGLTTKLHALVDADGRLVGLRLTGGKVQNACKVEALIEVIPEGATLFGDKGCGSTAIREAAAGRNIWANIPNRSNGKQPFGFSSWLYRQHNLVERFFNRI